MKEDDVILKVEKLSKQYRLGLIGTGTISHDLNRFWHKLRGKDDPYLKIGETNDRSEVGSSQYVWALQDINFEVKKGEVLGIIGKNGAGKSTLLKILSKVTSPTIGEIKTKGRIASLLEVGTGFHGEMTGRENVYLNGAILGMTKKEITSKLDDIIEFSGCDRYIDTPVKRYSSGMTVRLAFAVAAFLEPEILVIDEVLAVGDAEFQKKAIGKMQDISKGEGRTVLFVSHNMVAVKDLCNRAILIEQGKILTTGDVNEVVDQYLAKENDLVSGFKDLTKLRREVGTSQIMESIDFLNEGDVISGKDFSFRINFDKKYSRKMSFGYLLKDEKGSVIHAANMKQYDIVFDIKEKKYFDVVLENLPLSPGKYIMSLYFGDGKYDLDVIEEAVFFQVFWNSKSKIKAPIKKWGNVFISNSWKY